MLVATAVSQSATDPPAGLVLCNITKHKPRPGWSVVRVAASSPTVHDLWTLRGGGHPHEWLPIAPGCDAAGHDEDANEVPVCPVIAGPDADNADEMLDRGRALLPERHNRTFAGYLSVSTRDLNPRVVLADLRRSGRRAGVAGAPPPRSSRCWPRAPVPPAAARTSGHIPSPGARARPYRSSSGGPSVLRPGGATVIAGVAGHSDPPADLGWISYTRQCVLGSTGFRRAVRREARRPPSQAAVSPTRMSGPWSGWAKKAAAARTRCGPGPPRLLTAATGSYRMKSRFYAPIHEWIAGLAVATAEQESPR
ncbi:Zn-dependent oxidoreductase [Streptomyces sp. L7]